MKRDDWKVEIIINGDLAYSQRLLVDEIDKLIEYAESIAKNMAFEPCGWEDTHDDNY